MKKISVITKVSCVVFFILSISVIIISRPIYNRLEKAVVDYTQEMKSLIYEKTGLHFSYESFSPSVLSAFYVKNIQLTDSSNRIVANIQNTKVSYKIDELFKKNYDIITNEKLYINREEGFIGTSLKKDEFVCTCSDIDDIIIFYKDGKYKIVKVADKMFVGKNILYLNVFKKNDTRTIYNVIYRDGRDGLQYMKRFAVTGVSRDKEYDLTQGKPGSRITWFSANSNGEAEVLKITFKPKPRMKALYIEKSFSEIAIKGRQSMGNIVTKNEIHRISLKEKGESTLGGLKVWFDRDVLRLNYDGRGEYIGEFSGHDSILVVLKNGDFYTSNFDITNHYENDIIVFEKYEEGKVWTAVLNDASQQGYPYIKRFQMENSRKKQNFLGENPDSTLILLTDEPYARVGVTFGGGDSFREAMEVEAEEFIGVKSFKAKGKRLTTFEVEEIKELEPTRQPEEKEPEEVEADKSKQPFVEIDDSDTEETPQEENLTPDENGQMHLF